MTTVQIENLRKVEKFNLTLAIGSLVQQEDPKTDRANLCECVKVFFAYGHTGNENDRAYFQNLFKPGGMCYVTSEWDLVTRGNRLRTAVFPNDLVIVIDAFAYRHTNKYLRPYFLARAFGEIALDFHGKFDDESIPLDERLKAMDIFAYDHVGPACFAEIGQAYADTLAVLCIDADIQTKHGKSINGKDYITMVEQVRKRQAAFEEFLHLTPKTTD